MVNLKKKSVAWQPNIAPRENLITQQKFLGIEAFAWRKILFFHASSMQGNFALFPFYPNETSRAMESEVWSFTYQAEFFISFVFTSSL